MTVIASKLAVFTTFVAIATCFASEHRNHTNEIVDSVAPIEPPDEFEPRLTKHASVFSNEEKYWIEVGKRRDVGWLIAFSDLQHGQSSIDQLVHHIQESPANVLLIDSISDNALATICQMPRLRALVIHNSDVTDAGLKHLLKMPQLETVGCYYCDVTQEGVDQLRKLMPQTHFELYDSSKNGLVFDWNGCPSTSFRQAYMKPASWR